MTKLSLGYSPFNTPNGNPIQPFQHIFDYGVNLRYASNLNAVDAILLWGGSDISPMLYDEHPYKLSGPPTPSERDVFEWELMRQAKLRGIPMIGVCRGAQIICAFAGGKLIQHVTGHGTDHMIDTYDDCAFMVSSSHHQMMYPYDVDHKLLAWSSKSLSNDYEPNHKLYCASMEKQLYPEAEVVHFPDIRGLAIQCHPEWHAQSDEFNKWLMLEIEHNLFSSPSSCEC
jgi:anthranilate/para-aminobenzoate synthase component II